MNYIIDFEPTVSAAQIEKYLTDNQLTVVSVFDHFANVYVVSGAVEPPKTDDITSVVIDDTHSIQLLDTVQIVDDAPEITFDHGDQNWWKVVSLVKADLAAPTTTMKVKGEQVNVYLLDSGIMAEHDEFKGSHITELYSVTGEYADTSGHGTALASLITGATCSFANPALKVVKIFDGQGNVKQSQLLAALDAIIADATANPSKLAIANMSWSIPRNQYIEQKIETLMDNNVIVVAAAGNSGLAIEDVTPASMDRVITIGAYNQSFEPCDFSDYTGESIISNTQGATNGGALDGWAPGDKIYVANITGGYGYAAGTSLAAAIHTAVCAYNGVMLLSSEGDVLPCYGDAALDTKAMSLNRKDLLALDDPKYANSINLISTCFNEFTENQRVPKLIEYIAAPSGVAICRRLFHPLMVSNYEIVGNMPDGMTMYNGTVSGTLVTSKDYEVLQFQVNITTTDDQVLEQTVYVMVHSVAMSELPTDDPVLAVMALACSGFTCGSCTGSNFCGCGTPKSGTCECLCQQCACQ